MADNFYKSNKKLTDRGWQAMQAMLDREMPAEQRRRRPVLLFWLAGLLLVSSGIVIWHIWPEKQAPATPVSIQPVADAQRHNSVKQKDLTPALAEEISPKAAIPAESGIPATSFPTGNPKVGNRSITKRTPNSESAKETIDAVNLKLPETIESDRETASSIENFNTPEYAIQAESQSNPDDSEKAESLFVLPVKNIPERIRYSSEPTALQILPGLRHNLPETSLITKPDVPANPIDPVAKNAPPRAWAFGVTTGLLSNLDVQYSGFTAGLAAEWLPSAKWGLRGSLLYQFQALGKDERTILQLRSDTYSQLTGDPFLLDSNNFTPSSQDANAVPVYVPVSRLHRLELPVQAFWQPLEKWRLYGGLGLGLNMFAQSATRSLRDNYVLDIPSGNAGQKLNQEISAQVRNWDFRWNVGLGFRPNRRFAFDLLVHNPLRIQQVRETSANADVKQGIQNEAFGYQTSGSRPEKVGDYSLLQLSASMFF